MNLYKPSRHTFFVEALGAFLLILVYGLTSSAFAFGFTLMALVYMGWNISGAHFNPAISFAFFLAGSLSFKRFLAYSGFQILGGFLAVLVLLFATNKVFYVEPSTTEMFFQHALTEFTLPILLSWVYLIFATDKKLSGSAVYGLVIGLTYTGIVFAGDAISGAVFNPAISIASSVVDFIYGGNSYYYIPLFTLAPLAGASVATLIWKFLKISEEV